MRSLLVTMLNRAHSLSPTIDLFNKECDEIRTIFSKIQYPSDLIENTINVFNQSNNNTHTTSIDTQDFLIRLILPFINQKCADIVQNQISHLKKKIKH